jgi:hypothetical protein
MWFPGCAPGPTHPPHKAATTSIPTCSPVVAILFGKVSMPASTGGAAT